MKDGFLLCLLVIPVAFALDWMIGDPRWKYHPIRVMGKMIENLEPRFRAMITHRFIAGGAFALSLIGGTFCISFIFTGLLWSVSPLAGFVFETVLVFFCISARDLEKSAMSVYQLMVDGNTDKAKRELAMIVGRDTEHLSEEAVSRACVETVSENLVDGVIAPIFFAALGGAPLALAYKMTNTLDSMVGYKNEKYLFFGKASARIDDIANYLPARLAVPLIVLAAKILTGNGSMAFQTAKNEGRRHTSPNAGYSEAAFAGAFAIRLGGPNYYQGTLVEKPFIGSGFGNVKPVHIKKSCDLMMLTSFLAMIFLWVLTVFLRCWF